MNLPNQLTVARLLLSAAFVVVLSLEFRGSGFIAFGLFVAAAVTDFADGHIARANNLVTNFGKLMDPLADKIMVSAAFVFLAALNAIPAWFTVLVITREFLVTGLRLIAAAQSVVLPAEKLGKHKMAWQIATAVFFLLIYAVSQWNGGTLPAHFEQVRIYAGWFLLAVTATLTLVSGAGYLWNNKALIRDGVRG